MFCFIFYVFNNVLNVLKYMKLMEASFSADRNETLCIVTHLMFIEEIIRFIDKF